MPRGLSDYPPTTVGQAAQYVVAGHEAVAIVDVLQVIDIEQQDAEHVAAALRELSGNGERSTRRNDGNPFWSR